MIPSAPRREDDATEEAWDDEIRQSVPSAAGPDHQISKLRHELAQLDGLKGFPEAIISVFPQTLVQTCIVRLIRNSLSLSGNAGTDRSMSDHELRAVIFTAAQQNHPSFPFHEKIGR